MADSDALAYVTAAAPLLGLDLSRERVADIAEAFAQVQRFAAPALGTPIPPRDDEAPQ